MSFVFSSNEEYTQSSPKLNEAEYISALHTVADADTLVQLALDTALNLSNAHSGSLFLWDERSKELVLKAYQGPNRQKIRDVRIKLREGICGLVAEQGRALLVKDIESDYRFNTLQRNGRYQTRSFLSLPLHLEHKLIGVINITEKEDGASFNEEDKECISRMSKHVALAYDNLRIRLRLQSENEMLNHQVGQLKEELSSLEKLAAIGKVASNLAHELTNPLDSIRRFINLALDQVMEDSLARTYLVKAKTGVRNSVRIIRGLLTFCRESFSSTTRTADIHVLITESIESLKQDAVSDQVLIEKTFCAESVHVQDRGLQLVFKNLFENACYAMKNEVSNGRLRQNKITVQTRRENGSIFISIRDNGSGISKDIRPKIFDPFFTTKQNGEGTGIGLAICQEIVERCGGEIALADSNETGAEFMISLPIYK